MGLKPDEFWASTPRTWEVYVEGYRDKQRRSDYGVGLICAVIVNAHRDPQKGRAAQPEDFMPRDPRPQTLEDQVLMVKALTAAFGGTVEE